MSIDYLTDEKRGHLLDSLRKINNEISISDTNLSDQPVYLDSQFCETVVNWLTTDSQLHINDDMGENEYFAEHRFKGKIGRQEVDIWGSALQRVSGADDLYELHLFASDYVYRTDIEEMTTPEYQKIVKRVHRFFSKAATGEALRLVLRTHDAYTYLEKINHLATDNRIATVRCWILSNRLFTGGVRTGRIADSYPETTVRIVDLQQIGEFFQDTSEINQSFEGIGGLDAIYLSGQGNQEYECILSAIHGNHLAELYSIHGPNIVRENVRAFLGDVVVNTGIQNTVKEEPTKFLAYNNGLVVTAEEATVRDGKLLNLKGIQIINGGQTTASIYQCLVTAKGLKAKKDPELQERGQKLISNIRLLRIPMKVIVYRRSMDDEAKARFRIKISEAANSQNAVKASDLAANTAFQIEFARVVNNMRTPDGDFWFYENARGLYKAHLKQLQGNRRAITDFKKEHPASKCFGKTDFALAILACNGQATEAAKGAQVAFRSFNQNIEKEWPANTEKSLTATEAQALVSRWILFNVFEQEIKKDKDMGIKNPRVPVLYTLSLLCMEYKDRIRWSSIWNHQTISVGFKLELKNMVAKIEEIIRAHMGKALINMYGRKPECMAVVRREFKFEEMNFKDVFELN